MRMTELMRHKMIQLVMFTAIIVGVFITVGCDYSHSVYKCKITQVPNKTEYPVGYNGIIDMEGLQVVGVRIDNSERDLLISSYKPLSEFVTTGPANIIYWDDSAVDFSTPGMYSVYIFYLNSDKADDSFVIRVTQGCQGDGSLDNSR